MKMKNGTCEEPAWKTSVCAGFMQKRTLNCHSSIQIRFQKKTEIWTNSEQYEVKRERLVHKLNTNRTNFDIKFTRFNHLI